ncbi:MAG TPA: MFS transporter [Terriglobales bacterium]|nr:MFS transporter [Terriglobales bacterium]
MTLENATTRQLTWREGFALYLRPRLLVITAQGFASGIPLGLVYGTFGYWLSLLNINAGSIGLFTAVALPYTVKFLWAPFIDHVPLPLLHKPLGRRRSWLLLIQLGLAISIAAMGFVDPRDSLLVAGIAALIMSFFGASQDIVIDAYRIEILAPEEQGAGAAATQTGSKLGSLVTGAGALVLSDHIGWTVIFLATASFILLSAMITLIAPPSPDLRQDAEHHGYRAWLNVAVVQPFLDFAKRRGWIVILAFVLLYKYGDAIGGGMAYKFYHDMGFTGTEIAEASKIFGVIMSFAGTIVGGVVVARIGIFRSLLIGGVLQALTNFGFCYVAMRGHDIWALHLAIGLDNFAGGAAAAAFVAYLSSLTHIAYTATQFALFTSFMAFGRVVLALPGGTIVEEIGWANFYALTVLLAVPGMLLLLWLSRLYPAQGKPAMEIS